MGDRIRKRVLAGEPPLAVEDWPVFMMIDKLARYAHREQRDSLVDVAGYARTREMVDEERARRGA